MSFRAELFTLLKVNYVYGKADLKEFEYMFFRHKKKHAKLKENF